MAYWDSSVHHIHFRISPEVVGILPFYDSCEFGHTYTYFVTLFFTHYIVGKYSISDAHVPLTDILNKNNK